MFKEIFTESTRPNIYTTKQGSKTYIDGSALYKDIIRDIIDVSKNWTMHYSTGRIDVIPKSAKAGDLESGPKLAKKLVPKISKAIKKYGIKAVAFDIKQSNSSKRKNKKLYGGIRLVEM